MGMPQQSRYLNTRDEVADVFRLFRDQQSEIKLRFINVAQSYTARILDLADDEVLLQNVIPRDGAKHLRRGAEFAISGRADGLFVYITGNKTIDVDLEATTGYFKIAMPTSVLYQQRRRGERRRLPVHPGTHRSHVQLGTVPPQYGRILDVSENGVRIEVDPARPNSLRPQQRIDQCRLHVPNQLSIAADLIVRHTRYDPQGHKMTCGLEVLRATPEDLAALKEFVARITCNPL